MDKLILDALFPPPPDQLVADLNAVGADGAAVYVWRPGGVGTWTPGHVTALRAAGKLAYPIIVPEPGGGDINGMLGAARAFGFEGGPITIDQEPPNLPPASWEENFDSASAALGFEGFDYGTSADLGLYQPDSEDWLAEWIRTGQLQPLPTLPTSATGWQFVNDVTINGHQYDASVVASSVFGGAMADGFTDADRQMLSRIDADRQMLSRIGTDMFDGVQSLTPDGQTPVPADWPNYYHTQLDKINALEAAVAKLQQPTLPADFAAQVAAALIANTAFVDAMASAILHKAGVALGNA